MAKRKHHKKSHHRRHSIGAMRLHHSSPLVKYGSILVGFLAGKPINTAIDGIVPASMKANANYSKIAAGAEAGIGAALVFTKIVKKSTVGTVVGGVMVGAGIKRGLQAFNIISGYGNVPALAGYGKMPVLAGYTPNRNLAGYTPNKNLAGHRQVMSGVTEFGNKILS